MSSSSTCLHTEMTICDAQCDGIPLPPEVQAHLDQCPDCRAFQQEFGQMQHVLEPPPLDDLFIEQRCEDIYQQVTSQLGTVKHPHHSDNDLHILPPITTAHTPSLLTRLLAALTKPTLLRPVIAGSLLATLIAILLYSAQQPAPNKGSAINTSTQQTKTTAAASHEPHISSTLGRQLIEYYGQYSADEWDALSGLETEEMATLQGLYTAPLADEDYLAEDEEWS